MTDLGAPIEDSPSLSVEDILDWAGVHSEDRNEAAALLAVRPETALAEHMATLHSQLGKPGYHESDRTGQELDWLAALLWFIPQQVRWYEHLGVSETIARATLADVGRHMAISRRSTGNFGCETWWWLMQQASGTLFQLGRLQFQLQAHDATLPVGQDQDFDLGIHIPETGPMTPDGVNESLSQARPFFKKYFGKDVDWGVCSSWLLDPYLAQNLPSHSNIVSFAARFSGYGALTDAPDSALYFTFRTRNLDAVPQLPREHAIQRVVLERIEAGGTWQTGKGYMRLP